MSATLANPVASQVARREAPVMVGIVTRNRACILPKAVQSALSQSYPHIQIAVLDDGSEDATPSLRSNFPAVLWQRWNLGRGYMAARNELMRATVADYYLSLDDDAWFLDGDEVAVAVQYMEANPKVAAVGFDILGPNRPQRTSRSNARPAHMFIGCGHLVRLSAVRAAGFYQASPGLYGSEEKDLCIRFLDLGWDVHLLPGVHVWHDYSAIARDEPQQHRSGVCNDLAFTLRRCPMPLVLGVLPIKLVKHLRFALRRRLLKPCLAGFSLFFRHGLEVVQSRAPVRAATFREFSRRARAAV